MIWHIAESYATLYDLWVITVKGQSVSVTHIIIKRLAFYWHKFAACLKETILSSQFLFSLVNAVSQLVF